MNYETMTPPPTAFPAIDDRSGAQGTRTLIILLAREVSSRWTNAPNRP
jgi:hypothetical protein